MPTLLVVKICLVLGAPFVGSFLAVLMDRLARGEDVVSKRSACRSCAAVLGPRDLVPVVSFALHKGRCRACAAPIPAWLLYSELLATGGALFAAIAGADVISVLVYALFLWLLIALAGADLLWMRLPDALTLSLAITGFGLALLPGGVGASGALLGAVLGAGSFALLRAIYMQVRGVEGLGLGDIKLMVGLGAFAGAYDLALLVLIAALGALGIAAIQSRADKAALSARRPLPFGAALCAAAALIWVARVSGTL